MAIEKRAVEFYRDTIFQLHDQGTAIFTHKTFAKMFLSRKGNPIDYKIIRHRYGYDRTRPELRGRGLGMGTAALMCLVIAKEYQPDFIHVIGVEGYAPDNVHCSENNTHPELVSPDERTCKESNSCASLHLSVITNMFPETRFVFYGNMNHPNREAWRAEFVAA